MIIKNQPKFTLTQLFDAFDGRLVGDLPTKKIIAETILLLPEQIIEQLIDNVWFLSSDPQAWAYVFRGNDIANKYLIFLSDGLFSQSKSLIQYTILHEIAHALFDHRNSIGYHQTSDEIARQEAEADKFAKKYLSAYQASKRSITKLEHFI